MLYNIKKTRYTNTSIKDINTEMVSCAAKLTNNSTGKPNTIPNELPTRRSFDAGVFSSGSISLNKRTPELIVPVNIPNIEKKLS